MREVKSMHRILCTRERIQLPFLIPQLGYTFCQTNVFGCEYILQMSGNRDDGKMKSRRLGNRRDEKEMGERYGKYNK